MTNQPTITVEIDASIAERVDDVALLEQRLGELMPQITPQLPPAMPDMHQLRVSLTEEQGKPVLKVDFERELQDLPVGQMCLAAASAYLLALREEGIGVENKTTNGRNPMNATFDSFDDLARMLNHGVKAQKEKVTFQAIGIAQGNA